MAEKQQTAVEIIIAKIKAVKPTQFCSIETILEWCEQAKQLEKQQIMEAFEKSRIKVEINDYGSFGYQNAEQYFEETFKSE